LRDVPHTETPAHAATRAVFRQLMGLYTTGVCIVAVPRPGGGTAAMTVNSFVSVSLDPMLVCWSLQNASSQFDIYADTDRFTVSILSAEQGDLARRYAARGDSQMDEADFGTSKQGLPVVTGALGHIECRRWSEFPAGDHLMILGEVMGMSAVEDIKPHPAPLGFFNGQFCVIEQ